MTTVLPALSLPTSSAAPARWRRQHRLNRLAHARAAQSGDGSTHDAATLVDARLSTGGACTSITKLDQQSSLSPRTATALPAVTLPSSAALPAVQRRRQRQLRHAEASGDAAPETVKDQDKAVVLHVYDVMAPMVVQVNELLRPAGTGVFHAGIEVFGLEWSFGASPDEHTARTESAHVSACTSSAVASTLPHEEPRMLARSQRRESLRTRRSSFNTTRFHRLPPTPLQDPATGIFGVSPRECAPHKYRESVALGMTQMTKSEVMALLEELAREWPSAGYDLINRNCGHFSETLCRRLGVGAIPAWVTSFADAAATVQAGAMTAINVASEGDVMAAFTAQASHMYSKVDNMLGQALGRAGKTLGWFGRVTPDVCRGDSEHEEEHHMFSTKQVRGANPYALGLTSAWA